MDIFANGKEYISASRASKKIGYASDYIGQLCRAKKIPGKLIGRTWYVDFDALVEHKKNRRLGKAKRGIVEQIEAPVVVKKVIPKNEVIELTPKPSIVTEVLKNFSERREETKIPNKPVFIYTKEDKPRLPEILKYAEIKPSTSTQKPKFNLNAFKKFAAVTVVVMAILVSGAISLEKVSPLLSKASSHEVASVTLAGTVQSSVDYLKSGFKSLRDLALGKIYHPETEVKVASEKTYTLATEQAVRNNSTTTINVDVDSIRNDLKLELQTYLESRITSATPSSPLSPVVIYSSPQITYQTLNTYRDQEVVPVIHTNVTNQSTSDVEHLSSRVSGLVNGGTFYNAHFDQICLNGDCRSNWTTGLAGTFEYPFSKLSTGENATSTTLAFLNGFISTASSTLTDFNFANATGTSVAANYGSFNTICLSDDCQNTWPSGSGGSSFSWPWTKLGTGEQATSTTLAFLNGFVSTASTTLQNFTATNGTTTSLGATTLITTGVTNSILMTNAFGQVVGATAGTDYLASMSFAYPFVNNATNTLLTFNGGILSTASSTLQNFTFVNATGTSATTTNLATTNFCLSGDCRSTWPTAGTFAYPFTKLGTGENATSTTLVFLNGFISNSSSTINSSVLVTGSTTLQNFTATNGTTTSLAASTLITTGVTNSILKTNAFGQVVGATAGTDYLASMSFAYPFTKLGTGENATSTTLAFLNGFVSTASSTLASTTVTSLLANNATTTNLFVSNLASSTEVRANSASFGSVSVTGTLVANGWIMRADGTFYPSANDSNYFGGNSNRILGGFFGSAGIDSSGPVNTASSFSGTNLLINGSTTLQNFTFTNATGSNATTTNLFATTLFGSTGNLNNLTLTGLGGSGTKCLQVDNAGSVSTAAAACGTSGGGTGGGSWATTTSQTSTFINYSLNNSDIIAIGNTSTTSAKFYFDPNALFAKLGGDTLITGSSTLQNFTASNSTTTNSTSTNSYFSNSLHGPGLFTVDSLGHVGIGSADTSSYNLGIYEANPGGVAQTYLSINGGYTLTNRVNNYSAGINTGFQQTLSIGAGGVGASIYINGLTGNVGIATDTPASQFSVAGNSYFAGNINATGTLNISGDFTARNSTTTNATSTTLAVTTLCLTGDTCRTTWPTSGSFAYPFTKLGTGENATSTTLEFLNGFISTASSTLASTTVTSLLANNATTTNLFVSNLASTTELRANTSRVGAGYFGSATAAEQVLISQNGTYPGIWFGANVSAPSLTNYSFLYDSGAGSAVTILNSAQFVALRSANVNKVVVNTNGVRINNPVNANSGVGAGVGLTVETGRVGFGTSSPFEEFSVTGNSYLGGNLTATGTIIAYGDLMTLGSTTLQSFTATNSTTTSATTTSLAISGVTSSLLKTNANGSVLAAVAGTDYLSSMSFAYPFTKLGTGENATSTTLAFLNGFISSASSTLASTTVTSLLSTNSTSTNSYFSNTLRGPNNFAVNSLGHVGIGGDPSSNLSVYEPTSGGTSQVLIGANNGYTLNLSATLSSANVNTGFQQNLNLGAGGVNSSIIIDGITNDVNVRFNLLTLGSTTLQSFTATNSTTTSATTTSLAISGVTSSLLKTNANGSVLAAVAGTDYLSSMSFAYPFTKLGTGENATSTTLEFLNGFISTASSTLSDAIITRATTTSGTTTNLYIAGPATYGIQIARQTGTNHDIWAGPTTYNTFAYGAFDKSEFNNVFASQLSADQNYTSLLGWAKIGSTTSASKTATALAGLATVENTITTAQNAVKALDGQVIFNARGDLTNAYGLYTSITKANSGSITNAYGIYVDQGALSGSGTLTNNTGIKIVDQTAGTNNRAIDIAQSIGTNNYSIYSSGLGKSYFAGSFGIGSSTPTEKLSVEGNAYISGNITATGTLSVTNILALGSSTLQSFTASNSTTTNATTTNLFASGLASTTNLRSNTAIFGMVGIGSTSPTSLLSIQGTAPGTGDALPALTVLGGDGAASPGFGGKGGGIFLTSGNGVDSTGGVAATGGDITLTTGAGALRNSSDIAAGVGGTLTLASGAGGAHGASNAGGRGGAINILAGNGGTSGFSTGGTGGSITFNPGAGGVGAGGNGSAGNIVLATLRGNVGVGTSSPFSKLSVFASASSTYTHTLFAIGSSTSAYSTSTLFTVEANGLTTAQNFLTFGTTTLQSFTASNSTTTNATTTNLAVTTLCLTGDSCRTTWPTSGSFAYPFTKLSTGENATSTTLELLNGFISTASSTLTNATTTNLGFLGNITNNGGSLTLTSSGAFFGTGIGLGTSTPFGKASIVGASAGNPTHFPILNLTSTDSGQDGLVINAAGQANDFFAFRVNTGIGQNVFNITQRGNVGVGSSSPLGRLTVHAGATDTYKNDLFLVASSTAAYSTSTLFVVKANGRVGIGTLDPTVHLDVYEPNSGNTATLNVGANGGYSVKLFAGVSSAGLNTGFQQTLGIGASGAVGINIDGLTEDVSVLYNFLTLGSTTLQRFTATNGTTTNATSTNLAVTTLCLTGDTCRTTWPTGSGGSFAFPFTKQADNAQATSTLMEFFGGIYTNASSTLASTTVTTLLSTNSTSTNSYFSNTLRGPNNFTVNSTGVGVGIASPAAALDVISSAATYVAKFKSTAGFPTDIFVQSPDDVSYGASIEFVPYVYSGWGVGVTSFNLGGDFTIVENGAATRLQIQRSTGNVGIGTSTPNWRLETASSGPQFAITDPNAGTNSKHFLVSNIGGTFRIGTSSDTNINSTSTLLTLDAGGQLSINRLLVNGSTTLQTFTGISGTTTNFSTTNFLLSGASTGCAQFSNGGILSSTGVACGSGGGGAGFASTTSYTGTYSTGAALLLGDYATTSSARLTLTNTISDATGGSNVAIAGFQGKYNFTPSAGGVQIGQRLTATNTPTSVANTAVGELVRMVDDTALANLVRGLDVTASGGSNTLGVNTGIRATGHTFGVQGITTGLAGGTLAPAALYGENTGTTAGDILRLFSSTVTSAPSFATFYQATSTYTGTGLLVDFGRDSGAFTGNFLDLRNNTVSKFSVDSAGTTTIAGKLTVSTLTSCGGVQTNGSGTMSCTSDERLKDIQAEFSTGLAAVREINPETYSWKLDSGLYDGGIKYSGFIAQNIEGAIPEAVNVGAGGYKQVNTTTILATAINAIKELDLNLRVINGTASSTTPESESFVTAFWNSIKSKVGEWLADASNGIENIYTKALSTEVVYTKELCIEDVCINKNQLQALLDFAGQTSKASGSTISSNNATSSPSVGTSTPEISSSTSSPSQVSEASSSPVVDASLLPVSEPSVTNTFTETSFSAVEVVTSEPDLLTSTP